MILPPDRMRMVPKNYLLMRDVVDGDEAGVELYRLVVRVGMGGWNWC